MYKAISRILVQGRRSELLRCSVTHRHVVTAEDRSSKPSKVANLKKYWLDKYWNYVANQERKLEKKFPRMMKVYRVFSVGTRDVFVDMKTCFSKYTLVMKQGPSIIESFTLKELQLIHTMPKDLRKLFPVFLLASIPFANYIIFPLALYFPRYLLTSHYWTLQQKLEFMLYDHKRRLRHNKPLFRCMQTELGAIRDQKLRVKWQDAIACLGSGTHPSTENIIACSELFSGPPYSLDALKGKHLKELLAIHGMPVCRPFKRKRLMHRAILILQMDHAIVREGGVKAMPYETLRWALSFRGVNPANMSLESMRSWLEQWLEVSEIIDGDNISLLLHCPILLAYNHSTNWILIYS